MNSILKTTLATMTAFILCQLFGESLSNSFRAAIITGISMGILFDVHGTVFRKVRRICHG